MTSWKITDEERRRLADAAREHKAWGTAWLADYEAALGIPFGPLMRAFVALGAPDALEGAGMNFIFARNDGSGRTPKNVIPFAETTSSERFAFLVTDDPTRSTDERPICFVPRDPSDTRVIAPDLASFVSLLAVAGAWDMHDDAPDHVHWEARRERLEDDEDGVFGEMSDKLRTLPGVSFPKSPSAITRACMQVAFDVEEPLPIVLTLSNVQELWASGHRAHAERVLRALIDKWLDLGDLVPAANWAALRGAIAEVRPVVAPEIAQKLQQRAAWP